MYIKMKEDLDMSDYYDFHSEEHLSLIHIYTLKSEDNYNFVLIPDTQNTVKFKGAVMDKAVRELVSTADELNVKGVIHLGDVVEDNNDGIQYDTARQVFYQIPDAGIRFLVQPGNHDGWAGGTTNYLSLIHICIYGKICG